MKYTSKIIAIALLTLLVSLALDNMSTILLKALTVYRYSVSLEITITVIIVILAIMYIEQETIKKQYKKIKRKIKRRHNG